MTRAPAALPRCFHERPVLDLAAALLGCLLVRRGPGRVLRIGRIVEVEAYGGQGVDPSAHSFRGPTSRCEVMFGKAGRAYVYATQGACHCLNVTAEGTGDGTGAGRAVLIRAVEPLAGTDAMREQRLERLADGPTRRQLLAGHTHELARGPGRLCVAYRIDREHNAVDLTDAAGPLYLAAGEPVQHVRWTERIGLNPESASHAWRWRAIDADSRAVSVKRSGPGRISPRPVPARCPLL